MRSSDFFKNLRKSQYNFNLGQTKGTLPKIREPSANPKPEINLLKMEILDPSFLGNVMAMTKMWIIFDIP